MSHASRKPAGPQGDLGPVGIAPVELGVDQGPDVDAIDRQIVDLAVDVDVEQLDAPHHDPAQDDTAEPGATQVDGAQLRAAEVNALEPGATQIGTNEVSHATTQRHVLTICPHMATTEPNHAVGGRCVHLAPWSGPPGAARYNSHERQRLVDAEFDLAQTLEPWLSPG